VQPWQLFVLGTAAAMAAAAWSARGTGAANMVFLAVVVTTASIAAAAFYRTLWPLVGDEPAESAEMLGGKSREALEREKELALRAIKELEFDRAMGKVSDADCDEMTGLLRARAIGLMKQLDRGGSPYRELIERELAGRLRAASPPAPSARASEAVPPARGIAAASGKREDSAGGAADAMAAVSCRGCGAANDPDARYCVQCGAVVAAKPSQSCECGTMNDADARFCKNCGNSLQMLHRPDREEV
jgi:hypothetical protein